MTAEAEQPQPRRTPRVVRPRPELSGVPPATLSPVPEPPRLDPGTPAQRRPEPTSRSSELRQGEGVQGGRPGDRYARIRRWRDFQRVKAGHLRLGSGVGQSKGPVGRAYAQTKRVLLGRPLATHEEPHERVNVFTGLAVFASDNISSSAYATE